MMTRTIAAVLSSAGLAFSAQCWADTHEELSENIPQWLAELDVPGASVSVIDLKSGEEAWFGAFGDTGRGEKVTLNTVYNVASLTKPVFSMMVLQLVADGALDLDQTLSEYHTDKDLDDDERRHMLTPRILLSHQSGLTNSRGSGKLAFEFTPGTKTRYSGEGFNYLLNAVVAKTEVPFQRLMDKHVLRRAQMTRTSFGWQPWIESNVALGHDIQLTPIEVQDLKQRVPNAAANMFTTIGDYTRFAEWVLRGANLPRHLLQEMRTPQASHDTPWDIGLGWFLMPEGREMILHHSGIDVGYYTLCVLLPERQQGVVVLTNGDNGELLARRVLEASIPNGALFNQQSAKQKLSFLRYMSPMDLVETIPDIVKSPAHMETMFLAITGEAMQNEDNGLATESLALADSTFKAFVRNMRNGDIGPESAKLVLERIIDRTENGPRVRIIHKEEFGVIVDETRRILGRGVPE